MPGSVLDLYRDNCVLLQFDPQNTGDKLAFYRMLNVKMLELYQQEPWKFAMATGYVTAYGDYTTGTALFTSGNRVVTGTGTAWASANAESAWIAPGTNPTEDQWVRIGRVASDTQILLVDPYPFATTTSASYTIRWRFAPLPRDVLSFRGITARVNNFGPLKFISDVSAQSNYLDLITTGNPIMYTPAVPPQWRRGAGIPDSPATAPTLTASLGAGLSPGVYQYRYTWYMNGIETGSSPIASITISGAINNQVQLSGLEQVGALQGRYARIYRADATGIFYRIADVTTTTYTDDGSTTDYTLPYYEGARTQYVRFYPRPTVTSFLVDLLYHARPRLVQKDSDYLDMPLDAESAVLYGAIASIAAGRNKPAIAAKYDQFWQRQIDLLRRTELTETPDLMTRDGIKNPPGRWRPQLVNPARLV